MRAGLTSFAHVHAASYARLLAAHGDVEVIAVDPDDDTYREQARALAERFGVRLVPSYDDLLAEGPDGVVVCSENSRHRSDVERAARAGAAVLCEKPLATSLTDARAMVEVCERAGVTMMTAYPVRFSPAVTELKRLTASGRLGEIIACSGVNNGRMPARERGWFVDPELAGGGAVIDHTVHLADILLMLVERPATEVYAQANELLHAGAYQVETAGLLMVGFEGGASATIDCSWSRPESYPTWGGLTLEVTGPRHSTVTVDVFGQAVTGYGVDGVGEFVIPVSPDPDVLMIEEFCSAIREHRPPTPDGEAGVASLEIALAAYESIRCGQPVPLPLSNTNTARGGEAP